MNGDLHYREAVEGDANDLVEFLKVNTVNTFINHFKMDELLKFIDAFTPELGRYWIATGFVYLALCGDKIVGLVAACKCTLEYSETSKLDGEIKKLYIAREFHGKGVAGTLFKKGMDWLNISFPSRPVSIEVYNKNHRAIAFYKKQGFEIVCKVPCAIENEICVIMRK
ncbi:hypothetical protein HDV01_005839 [Terramyces sp. JEL0728]|nr:hypothetical protein HDV01_005839 [Terramyces sp. JEL0728]